MTADTPTIRAYRSDDLEALHRVWVECGWTESDNALAPLADYLAGGSHVLVADFAGAAECMVLMEPGTMRYLDGDLGLTLLSSVTTGRVARRRGLASRLSAAGIAADAEAGRPLAVLGMFEQGFYERLGFGNGAYVNFAAIDPAKLAIPGDVRPRPPHRLGPDDAGAMHRNRLERHRRHGATSFPAPNVTRYETHRTKGGFGLGYFDGPDGALSHHLWAATDGNDGDGPYRVRWMAWRTNDELRELLSLIAEWGDQVLEVRMEDPPGIMLQDYLTTPLRSDFQTRGALKHRYQTWHAAWWQARMLDVPRCVERARLTAGDALKFNLELTDPIERYLPPDAAWRGVAGAYVVTLGRDASGATRGTDAALPTLRASVNAFTRLWIGAAPARGLEATTTLGGPTALIDALDRQWSVPQPYPDWPL